MTNFLQKRKRLRRHMVLATLCLIFVLTIFFALKLSPEMWLDIDAPKAESVKWRASMSFAYTAVLLFSVVLLIGPYYVLSKRPNPVNSFLRRDIAIWGGAMAVAHMLIAMFVHVSGLRFWQSFITAWPTLADPLPLKFNRIGLANYIGLLMLSIIILLLLLSNNWSLRRLGSRRWKNLQRLNYIAFGAIAVHGFLYHLIEQRLLIFRWLFYAVIMLVSTVQIMGFFQTRRRRRAREK